MFFDIPKRIASLLFAGTVILAHDRTAANAQSADSAREALWLSSSDCNVELATLAIGLLKDVNFIFTYPSSSNARGGHDTPLQRFIDIRLGYLPSDDAERCLLIIQKLFDAKADPDFRATAGTTALHVATANKKDAAVVTLALAAGADPNARAGVFRETPLMFVLDDLGRTDPEYRARNTNEAWAVLLPITDLNLQDGRGETVLMKAARAGNVPAVRALLERHANTTLKDLAGKTALGMALGNGQLAVVTLLASLPQ